MKPGNPLPWATKFSESFGGLRYASGVVDAKCERVLFSTVTLSSGPAAVQNDYYIVHAANAYPKLVEALTESLSAYSQGVGMVNAMSKAQTLLRELGESA